jgi:hypothetical protein
MESEDQFAQWAVLFSRHFGETVAEPGLLGPLAPASGGIQYSGVTAEACELLRAVDAGGVPAFVTSHLKQIAADNGLEVGNQSTPNEIIDAIRGKARTDSAGCPLVPD